jgi:hypothetical protein
MLLLAPHRPARGIARKLVPALTTKVISLLKARGG